MSPGFIPICCFFSIRECLSTQRRFFADSDISAGTSELGMQRAEDEDILALAGHKGCVVIILDADFHTLVAVQGLNTPSVIRLRREGCKTEAAVAILGPVLERYAKDLEEGVLDFG